MAQNGNVSAVCRECMSSLKQLRIEKKYTAEDVASYLAAFGIIRDARTIRGWEYGVSEPPMDAFLYMARMMECPDLYTLAGIATTLTPCDLSDEEVELIRAYRRNASFHQAAKLLLGISSEE